MKIQAKAKDCQLLVKVKTSSKETIDAKELDRFSRIFLRGFLKPRVIKKNLVEYTGPVGISLYERLKRPIAKREFLFLLEQVVVAVEKLQAHRLGIHSVIMNLSYIYINEVTKEVQFIYIPIVGGGHNLNVVGLFEAIAYSVKPAEEEDKEYVSRFIFFLKAMNPFDSSKIEAFVAREDQSVVNTIKRQNVGQSGFMTNKQQQYYDHYDQKKEAPAGSKDTGLFLADDSTGLLLDSGATELLRDEEGTGLLCDVEDEEATRLLCGVEDEDETSLLLYESKTEKDFPALYRLLTEEVIRINKPVFRLGKERSCVDYFVTNNIAVSRSHADIITRGGHYYVKDLNSKNHTYINDRELQPLFEAEIQDGDRLKLGNEEFMFYVGYDRTMY